MRLRLAAMLVPLLAATAACSSSESPRADDSAEPSPSAASFAWERADLKPVTRPVLAGGRLVLYTHDTTHLSVTALDPATGKTAWSERASDSGITGGVAFPLTVVGGRVVFLEASTSMRNRGTGRAVAVAVDAATGRRAWTGDLSAIFRDMPEECDDDKRELCASGNVQGRTGILRVALADGATRLITPATRVSRGVGDGLYDTGERAPDYLARVTDEGRQVWKRPLREVFGVDVSSDTSWNWRTYGDLQVGSMGRREKPDADEHDLGGAAMAGVDPATGRTVWRMDRRALQCVGVAEDVLGTKDALPYRCAYQGTLRYLGDRETDASAVRAVIEGFEPRTGRTTWSVDVGPAPALAFDDPGPMGLGGTVVAVPRPDRPALRIDLRTGESGDLTEVVTGWCAVSNPYPLSTSASYQAERQGETLQVPCRSDGSPISTPGAAEGFGVQAAGVLAWASRDGVRAVRTS